MKRLSEKALTEILWFGDHHRREVDVKTHSNCQLPTLESLLKEIQLAKSYLIQSHLSQNVTLGNARQLQSMSEPFQLGVNPDTHVPSHQDSLNAHER